MNATMTWPQLLIAALVPCVLLGFTLPGMEKVHAGEARRIDVTAKRFEFAPSDVTVKKGEPVVLVFHSQDVTHGIRVNGLKIEAEIPKGKSMEVPFTPVEVGDFSGRCSHFCGEGHGEMTFNVHVTE